MKKLNARTRIFNALHSRNLTVEQAQGLFAIKNVSARVSELRQEGHQIDTLVKYRKTDDVAIGNYKLACTYEEAIA